MHNLHQRLLLVDGSNYLYRAYHAMSDLKNSQGLHTGALYGLTSMLRKLKQAYPSTYCACIFDHKDKTFRHDLYSAYKANRPPMPPQLAEQLVYVDELIQALGWPIVRISGVEADDIMGTLAHFAQQHMPVLIATGDKDMAQLVNDNIHLIDTMKNTYMDIQGVQGKFDLEPKQIIDYLALMGDTSDNVPGISKVGPKTAVKWLKQYQTLDNIIANAHVFTGVVGDNLRAGLNWLSMSKALVTIKLDCDAELEAQIPQWQSWRPFSDKAENHANLKQLFQQFEFKGWLKEIEKLEQSNLEKSEKGEAISDKENKENINNIENATQNIIIDKTSYVCIQNLTQLENWIAQLNAHNGIVAIDTETTSLNPMQAELVGISMALQHDMNQPSQQNTCVYIPIADHPQQTGLQHTALDMLKSWLENAHFSKVGQNIKYDLHIFKRYNIDVQGLNDDTMLASYVLASHYSHNLDDLARRYLQHQSISYESICGKGAKQITFDQVDIQTATQYAAEDADMTLHLHHVLQKKLQKIPELYNVYHTIECPIAHVLLDIERTGIVVDKQELNNQSNYLAKCIDDLEKEAFTLAGKNFNLNSPKQIAEILFNELKLPVVKKTSGGAPSTDEEVLTKLAHDYPLPKLLLEHRSLFKLKTTYTDKLPVMINAQTQRVHTSFAQAVAVTGRLSSNEPNLQNIPIKTIEGRKIRQAFIAKQDACLLSVDYSQIELRIMAHLSQDNALIQAFNTGQDVHIATAKEIFNLAQIEDVSKEQRRFAKVINFGLIYGMSAFGVANNLGIETKAAQIYIDTYFERYKGVAAYMQSIKMHAREYGYVETILGRRLYLPDIESSMYLKRQASERAAINAPMQGSAADIIKLAMLNVWNYLQQHQLQTRIVLQVHDELILEVPYDELEHIQHVLPDLMQNVYTLRIPLLVEVGIGDTWEEAH
jgi:DNA polymerase I